MKSKEMSNLVICVGCATFMFDAINNYHFSFMQLPALLTLVIYFISVMFFLETWFYDVWGLFTGFVILIPMMMALFQQNNNWIAYLFDGGLSLFFIGYYGYKCIMRFDIKKKRL